MCQLFLGRFKDGKIAKVALANASVINSLKGNINLVNSGHVDGTGFWINEESLYKTEAPGWNINYSKIHIKDNVPFILHVRKKSKGAVDKENAHPFQFKDFVAAHNGTLKGDSIEETDSDSKQFFQMVQEELDKNRELTLPEAVKKAYESIDGGKFAFLMYDKRTGEFFIIRGMATLYWVQLKKNDEVVGIIVNTELGSLKMQLMLLGANYGLYAEEPPELIPANTVHKLVGYELEKLDINIEQKNLPTVVVYHNNSYWNGGYGYGYQGNRIKINTTGHGYWYGKKLSQLILWAMLNMQSPDSQIFKDFIDDHPKGQLVPGESYTYIMGLQEVPEEVLQKIREVK